MIGEREEILDIELIGGHGHRSLAHCQSDGSRSASTSAPLPSGSSRWTDSLTRGSAKPDKATRFIAAWTGGRYPCASASGKRCGKGQPHSEIRERHSDRALCAARQLIRPTALFDGNCKDIADAAFGLDDMWLLRVCLQFAPQPQHLNVDAAIENIFVEPGRLQQILARKRSLRRIDERHEQGAAFFLAKAS